LICFAFKLEIPWIIGTASTWELADTVLSAVTYLEGGTPKPNALSQRAGRMGDRKIPLDFGFRKKPFWPPNYPGLLQLVFGIYYITSFLFGSKIDFLYHLHPLFWDDIHQDTPPVRQCLSGAWHDQRGIGRDREYHVRGPHEPSGDVISNEDVPPG